MLLPCIQVHIQCTLVHVQWNLVQPQWVPVLFLGFRCGYKCFCNTSIGFLYFCMGSLYFSLVFLYSSRVFLCCPIVLQTIAVFKTIALYNYDQCCTVTVATCRVPVDPCTTTGDSSYFPYILVQLRYIPVIVHRIDVQFQGIPKRFHWNLVRLL